MHKKSEKQIQQEEIELAWVELARQPEMIRRSEIRRIYSKYLQGCSVEDIRVYLRVNNNLLYSERHINTLIDTANAALF